MKKKDVLIFGSGHLVFRLKKILHTEGYHCIQCYDEKINNISVSGSIIDNLAHFFKDINIENVLMIYLLDDKDENNLQLIIALSSLKYNIPITASLFNENFFSNLFKVNNNVTIINPAKIAAPEFVETLYKKYDMHGENVQTNNHKVIEKKPDYLIKKLLILLLTLSVACIGYFHYFEHMTWINAVYFVVVIITTVGFGDLNLLASSDISKIIGVILMLGSTILIWMIFSLTIDYFLKNRIQLALGRKKYHTKNHVIVCGLGRLGYFIVEELLKREKKVIIIEINEEAKHVDYFRSIGADVYIGDARSEKVLSDVNIKHSAALISVINNDALNIEIGLHARTLYATMKIVLRIFDEDIAVEIKNMLNIQLAMSNSAIASKSFFNELKKYDHEKHSPQ
ncbi:MAG: potassium channel family protein [Bacteroidetes bacterium]|jgi:hypothetical protein|nr:potassium channel family protein [Bacteroidota bacterium]MBK9302046.1 potassium channel family protein [Bacteroidota bacterium]